ncbi:response regulator [Thermomonas sp.]|uniref:response regulator n=1 Tax=Thermomonas sp. TaxID=1971895 RepID=UPI00248A2CAF|nr:response regulator [Thermomonas sp.]MDI1252079.1 response regulator [Thermomonas sp.]
MITILMVEDEMNLAMMLEDILDDAGYRVLKAARLPNALEIVVQSDLDGKGRIDAAILDINLAGVQVFPLADVLRERGVPFVFTSGYGRDGIPDAYGDSVILQKPYGVESILSTLQVMLADRPAAD